MMTNDNATPTIMHTKPVPVLITGSRKGILRNKAVTVPKIHHRPPMTNKIQLMQIAHAAIMLVSRSFANMVAALTVPMDMMAMLSASSSDFFVSIKWPSFYISKFTHF